MNDGDAKCTRWSSTTESHVPGFVAQHKDAPWKSKVVPTMGYCSATNTVTSSAPVVAERSAGASQRSHSAKGPPRYRPASDTRRDAMTIVESRIPEYERANRGYLTIAIGCTGGQHRSVFMAGKLGAYFTPRHPLVLVRHTALPDA